MPTKQTHSSWTTRALRRWTNSLAWVVHGDGQYAVVSACGRWMTATLYPTPKDAREGLAELDRAFCGGECRGGEETTG